MKKDKEKIVGYPEWAQKPWWVRPDGSILTEYLKVLIGIKKNVPNISARIHEVSTIISLRYLSNLIFNGGKITKENVNPNTKMGPDIKIEGTASNGHRYKCYAEVVTNFSFKEGPEANRLYSNVKKLKDSDADKKFLVVLFEKLIEKAEGRCKKRRNNPIDLDKHNILILSIEKMIGSTL